MGAGAVVICEFERVWRWQHKPKRGGVWSSLLRAALATVALRWRRRRLRPFLATVIVSVAPKDDKYLVSLLYLAPN